MRLFIAIGILCFSLICAQAENKRVPERIVSLAPSVTESLYAMGAGDKIIANTTYCVHPEGALKKIKIGNTVEIDVEKVASLKPDLVIGVSLSNVRQLEKLKALGIEVVTFPYPKSFEEVCSQFLEMGAIVGAEEEAKKIVGSLRSELKALQNINSDRTQARKKVFLQLGDSPLFTATNNTFGSDIIHYAGGENAVSISGVGYYSREKLLKDDPDLIVIINMGEYSDKEKEKWLKYSSLKAAKKGAIFIVDAYTFCTPIPMNFVKAVKEMQKLIGSIK